MTRVIPGSRGCCGIGRGALLHFRKLLNRNVFQTLTYRGPPFARRVSPDSPKLHRSAEVGWAASMGREAGEGRFTKTPQSSHQLALVFPGLSWFSREHSVPWKSLSAGKNSMRRHPTQSKFCGRQSETGRFTVPQGWGENRGCL